MQNIPFLKKQLFPKSCFFEKVDALQKNLLRESSSSVDIFGWWSFRKVTALKNFLFLRCGFSVEVWLWKSSYSEKLLSLVVLLIVILCLSLSLVVLLFAARFYSSPFDVPSSVFLSMIRHYSVRKNWCEK